MALLIDIGMPEWMPDEQLRDLLTPRLPGVDIYCGTPTETLADVTMIAVADRVADVWKWLPGLRLVQKLGAGVDEILADPGLPPDVRVARMSGATQARGVADYCLTAVLMWQHNFPQYRWLSQTKSWRPLAPKRAADTVVSVLGLGRIGGVIATEFAGRGYQVEGWSRSEKHIEDISCYYGEDGLFAAVANADYVIAALPSTDLTRDLFEKNFFAALKPGAMLINVGRGDQLVEDDLLAALDQELLGGALLDVTREEPLPLDSRLWLHEKVLVTPHVAGWHVSDDFEEVASNYRRLGAGESLLHEVDRASGYAVEPH